MQDRREYQNDLWYRETTIYFGTKIPPMSGAGSPQRQPRQRPSATTTLSLSRPRARRIDPARSSLPAAGAESARAMRSGGALLATADLTAQVRESGWKPSPEALLLDSSPDVEFVAVAVASPPDQSMQFN